ncbi:hypothetical protein Agub_g11278, partial [Astrephomene gubernaculifera]
LLVGCGTSNLQLSTPTLTHQFHLTLPDSWYTIKNNWRTMSEAQLDSKSFRFESVLQPQWSHSESLNELSLPVVEGVAYKGTRAGLVVQRGVALFKDRCTTYHNPESKTDARTWVLDKNCTLLPSTTAELVTKRRGVRPKGTWAITAAVQGVETHLDLYEVALDWPPSWAAAGYTSLVLGFPERAEAAQWHEALAGVLAGLRASKGHSRHASANRSIPDLSAPSPPISIAGARAGSDAAVVVATAAPAGDLKGNPPARPSGTATNTSLAAAPRAAADDEEQWADPGSDEERGGSSSGEEDEDCAPEPDERWVPYRQTNGVAIYHHAAEGKKSGGGGEYMVSCVIRGRPQRVAAALMRLRGNTTILGPAEHAEVLQRAEEQEGQTGTTGGKGKEILRLVLTASGSAGWFCAPREIILERMRKDEEDGVIVIMFKSVQLPNEANSKAGTGGLFGRGLYRRPVRGEVAGGYTIAGLRGEGAASRESLITCIVRVDLGGVCGSRSWVRPLSSAAGWQDSFLDRILMSVHLLRDEVEQRRFSVQPFKLVASAKARINQDGVLVGASSCSRSAPPARIISVSAASAAASSPSGVLADRPMARMATRRLSSGNLPDAPGAPGHRGASAGGVAPISEEGSSASPSGGAAASAAPDSPRFTLDVQHVLSLASMPRKYWREIHVPGADAPFSVRGATYLKDKKKVPAGQPAFSLGAVEMVVLPPPGTPVAGETEGTRGALSHVGRFIPSIRQGGAPFSIIIHLIVPGSPMLGLVAVFCCEQHPSILGSPPRSPMDEKHDWQPFDFVLHKFVYGSDETRNRMLKMVPHIASGSWMIKQSVGSTPVILGKALKTSYHCTPTYIEVDIDISANSVANYVTGMVRGATASLDIDLAFVLEGTAPWELPECLLGAFRLTRLDCNAAATRLDYSRELPLSSPLGGPEL